VDVWLRDIEEKRKEKKLRKQKSAFTENDE
jgi:hypothetical protein